MATITSQSNAVGAGTHPSRGIRQMPYVVENVINFASATTAKGSALAASDIIEALQIPAQSVVLSAGYEVLAAANASPACDVTLSVGVTGVSAESFVNRAALTSSTAVGAYPTSATAGYPIVTGVADTLDVLIYSSTTAVSTGKIRVWAVLCDLQDRREIDGLSVDRDQLA